MFMEAVDTRRALEEIGSVQKRLTDQQQGAATSDAQLNTMLTAAQSTLNKIADTKSRSADQGPGLADAYNDLTSALRVVESGDREAPAQAIAVYQQADKQIKKCMREWGEFKEKQLPQINEQLRKLPPITPSASE
jgi:hypothetical protein